MGHREDWHLTSCIAGSTLLGMTTTLANIAPARPALADLVERIRACAGDSTDPLETAQLVAGVLEQERPTPATLLTEEERAGSAESYVRHTLHTEARFSVQAVVWRPGQASDIHDHIVW